MDVGCDCGPYLGPLVAEPAGACLELESRLGGCGRHLRKDEEARFQNTSRRMTPLHQRNMKIEKGPLTDDCPLGRAPLRLHASLGTSTGRDCYLVLRQRCG